MSAPLVYWAEPIDQRGRHELSSGLMLARVQDLAPCAIYRPATAWDSNSAPDPRVEQTNREALKRADLLVAWLPAGIPSIGVPMEVEAATNLGIPVVAYHPGDSWALAGRPGVTQVRTPEALPAAVVRRLAAPFAPDPRREPMPVVLNGGMLPIQAYPDDAGLDLYVSADTKLPAGQFTDVPCSVAVQLPPWSWGLIIGRSSTFRKRGLMVLPSVIDAGWRGELFIGAWNTGETTEARRGERLGQLIILDNATARVNPVPVDALAPHARGTNGFGSSGE